MRGFPMKYLFSLILVLPFLSIIVSLNGTYNTPNPLVYHELEPQYPSYVSLCPGKGLCLKAGAFLPAGAFVGTATMVPTHNTYIPDNPDVSYRHVSILGFDNNQPQYGRVLGKYAFCNHSCDPNCIVMPNFVIKAKKNIAAHEELTVPYDAFISHMPWREDWSFTCACKQAVCRHVINRYRTDIIHPATYHAR